MISIEQIESTRRLIAPYLRRTPVLELAPEDLGIQAAALLLKLELLQHTGSFKARGAFAGLLSQPIEAAGVVTASGGNHGAAVAFAAMRRQVPARIFVPQVASPAKMRQIADYGAELVVAGERYADALAASEAWQRQSGARSVHAYDQLETLLGQGSIGLELEEQCPQIDTLLVAVGGGGLMAGIASWYRGRVRLIGVEPELAPTLTHALAAGRPVDAPAGGIAADSLAPRRVGALALPLIERWGSGTVLVSDEAIRSAQRLLWNRVRILAEPGGAAALAALISGRYRPRADERVAVLICGGNTDAVDFER